MNKKTLLILSSWIILQQQCYGAAAFEPTTQTCLQPQIDKDFLGLPRHASKEDMCDRLNLFANMLMLQEVMFNMTDEIHQANEEQKMATEALFQCFRGAKKYLQNKVIHCEWDIKPPFQTIEGIITLMDYRDKILGLDLSPRDKKLATMLLARNNDECKRAGEIIDKKLNSKLAHEKYSRLSSILIHFFQRIEPEFHTFDDSKAYRYIAPLVLFVEQLAHLINLAAEVPDFCETIPPSYWTPFRAARDLFCIKMPAHFKDYQTLRNVCLTLYSNVKHSIRSKARKDSAQFLKQRTPPNLILLPDGSSKLVPDRDWQTAKKTLPCLPANLEAVSYMDLVPPPISKRIDLEVQKIGTQFHEAIMKKNTTLAPMDGSNEAYKAEQSFSSMFEKSQNLDQSRNNFHASIPQAPKHTPTSETSGQPINERSCQSSSHEIKPPFETVQQPQPTQETESKQKTKKGKSNTLANRFMPTGTDNQPKEIVAVQKTEEPQEQALPPCSQEIAQTHCIQCSTDHLKEISDQESHTYQEEFVQQTKPETSQESFAESLQEHPIPDLTTKASSTSSSTMSLTDSKQDHSSAEPVIKKRSKKKKIAQQLAVQAFCRPTEDYVVSETHDPHVVTLKDHHHNIRLVLYLPQIKPHRPDINWHYHTDMIKLWYLHQHQALFKSGETNPESRRFRPHYSWDLPLTDHKSLRRICMIHNFSKLVDFYIKQYGLIQDHISLKTHQHDTALVLPGHVEYGDGNSEDCLFSYLIEPNTQKHGLELYHRNLDFRSKIQLGQEFFTQGFFTVRQEEDQP